MTWNSSHGNKSNTSSSPVGCCAKFCTRYVRKTRPWSNIANPRKTHCSSRTAESESSSDLFMPGLEMVQLLCCCWLVRFSTAHFHSFLIFWQSSVRGIVWCNVKYYLVFLERGFLRCWGYYRNIVLLLQSSSPRHSCFLSSVGWIHYKLMPIVIWRLSQFLVLYTWLTQEYNFFNLIW